MAEKKDDEKQRKKFTTVSIPAPLFSKVEERGTAEKTWLSRINKSW
jgi:hypothetical protein